MPTLTTSKTKKKPKSRSPKLELEVEISVRWEDDETPDLSYIGAYTDQDAPGAIDRKAEGDATDNELRYFVSGQHSVFKEEDWAHVPAKVKGKVIRQYGSLKNAVRAYARADYARMEAFNNGEWTMRGCIVTAKLGTLEAEDSIWGVESDCGPKHEAEIIRDCSAEAVGRLKEKVLKRLEVE